MHIKPALTPAQLAARFGCTVEQVLAQYAAVAKKMDADIRKAELAGKSKVGKYAIDECRRLAASQRELSRQAV